MNEFDIKAAEWDTNPMYWERSEAVAAEIKKQIPLNGEMTAMEYGAGTGLLSFLLRDHLKEITLIDSSSEMVRVINDKRDIAGADNMNAVKLDLETDDYTEGKFDLIYNLMVLHHVDNVENIIRKFHDLLNPGGYLVIADLCSEDGSFHGAGFSGHRGFDPGTLSALLEKQGFAGISHQKVYVIKKITPESARKQFVVFLMTARRPDAGVKPQ